MLRDFFFFALFIMMSNNFGKNHLENLTKLRNRQKASISIQSQVPLSSRRGYFFFPFSF